MPGEPATPDVVRIATLVRSCPLVDGLYGGSHDRIATHAGHARLVGVLVAGSSLVVGVVGRPGASTGEIVAQVRSALAVSIPGYQVTVSVRRGHDDHRAQPDRPVASD